MEFVVKYEFKIENLFDNKNIDIVFQNWAQLLYKVKLCYSSGRVAK